MPTARFSKQTLTMLENDLDMNTPTSTSNWAGDIKLCLESYGFQDVWTGGAVKESFYFSPVFKRKMVERFREELHTKIFNSDRFATCRIFNARRRKKIKTWTTCQLKIIRDSLVRLRFGINEIKIDKRYVSQTIANENCIFCPGILEDETLFSCSTAPSTLPSDKNTLRSLLTRKYHLCWRPRMKPRTLLCTFR